MYQIKRHADAAAVPMLQGIVRRTMTVTPGMMLCEFAIQEGHGVPLHQHPNDQSGYVVSGSIEFDVAGERHTLHPGDAYGIPGGVVHGARVVKGPCVLVEVFSPPREDYR